MRFYNCFKGLESVRLPLSGIELILKKLYLPYVRYNSNQWGCWVLKYHYYLYNIVDFI